MVKIKIEEFTVKDLVGFAFAVILAVLGYFIQNKLSDIDYSIKDFKQFQLEQSVKSATLDVQIKALQAKDSDLQGQIDYCVKKR